MQVPELNPNIHLTVDTGTGTYDTIWLGTPDTAAAAVVDATVRTGAGHCAVLLGTDGLLAMLMEMNPEDF